MCSGPSTKWIPSDNLSLFSQKTRPKRIRVRIHRLRRKRCKEEKAGRGGDNELMLKNLKLYMENIRILEENNRLRNRACLLHQENQSLMTQLLLQSQTRVFSSS